VNSKLLLHSSRKIVGPSDIAEASVNVQGNAYVQITSTSSKRLGKIISRVASLMRKNVS
jgi:hypothetical protein